MCARAERERKREREEREGREKKEREGGKRERENERERDALCALVLRETGCEIDTALLVFTKHSSFEKR